MVFSKMSACALRPLSTSHYRTKFVTFTQLSQPGDEKPKTHHTSAMFAVVMRRDSQKFLLFLFSVPSPLLQDNKIDSTMATPTPKWPEDLPPTQNQIIHFCWANHLYVSQISAQYYLNFHHCIATLRCYDLDTTNTQHILVLSRSPTSMKGESNDWTRPPYLVFQLKYGHQIIVEGARSQ